MLNGICFPLKKEKSELQGKTMNLINVGKRVIVNGSDSSRSHGKIIGYGLVSSNQSTQTNYIVELDYKDRGYLKRESDKNGPYISVVLVHPENAMEQD